MTYLLDSQPDANIIHSRPKKIQLPTELWFKILAYLDYFDFKVCGGVNRSLQNLTQHSDFDEPLFRRQEHLSKISTKGLVSDEPALRSNIEPMDIIQRPTLHPALSKFIIRQADHLQDTVRLTQDFRCHYRVTSAIASELATMLPISGISIRMGIDGILGGNYIICRMRMEDITVGDVLQMIAETVQPRLIWAYKSKVMAYSGEVSDWSFESAVNGVEERAAWLQFDGKLCVI